MAKLKISGMGNTAAKLDAICNLSLYRAITQTDTEYSVYANPPSHMEDGRRVFEAPFGRWNSESGRLTIKGEGLVYDEDSNLVAGTVTELSFSFAHYGSKYVPWERTVITELNMSVEEVFSDSFGTNLFALENEYTYNNNLRSVLPYSAGTQSFQTGEADDIIILDSYANEQTPQEDARYAGGSKISTGGGNDTIYMEVGQAPNSQTSITMGSGADQLILQTERSGLVELTANGEGLSYGKLTPALTTITDFELGIDELLLPDLDFDLDIGEAVWEWQIHNQDGYALIVAANVNPDLEPGIIGAQILLEYIAFDEIEISDNGRVVPNSQTGVNGVYGTENGEVLLGTQEDDLIKGLAGDDYLIANSGNDRLDGGEGSDQLFGQEGRDLLQGGAGDDILLGGADGDILYGSYNINSGDPIVDNDSLFGGDGNDALYGGHGNDYIEGNMGDDYIDTRHGVNHIFAGDGKDYVLGSGFIWGGEGDDFLRSYNQNDFMSGGAGDDIIISSSGQDVLEGGDGNDVIDGGSGMDTIFGGAGDDLIFGGQQSNSDSGGDVLFGGSGNDTLHGGEKNDYIVAGADLDVVHSGEGNDLLKLETDGGVVFWVDYEDGADKFDATHITSDTGITSFREAVTIASTLDGSGTWIGYQDTQIILDGVSIEDIDEEDFLLTDEMAA